MANLVPMRCVFCRFFSLRPLAQSRRTFSTSGSQANRKPSFPNIKAEDMKDASKADTAYSTAIRVRANVKASQILKGGPQTKRRPADAEHHKARQAIQQQHIDDRLAAYQPYTDREKQLLALKYTPEQLKIIEAGEAAIDPVDILTQARRRNDPFVIQYRDDFAEIQPVIDKPVRAPDEDIDPDIRLLTKGETSEKFGQVMENLAVRHQAFVARQKGYKSPQDRIADVERITREANIGPDDGRTPQQRMAKWREVAEYVLGPSDSAEYEQFINNPANFMYSPKGTISSQSSSLSVDLPKLAHDTDEYAEGSAGADPIELASVKKINEAANPTSTDDVAQRALTKKTGLSQTDIRALRARTLVFHRVTNQTRMGKISHFYALACAGDGDGMLGIGEANAIEPMDAQTQARHRAIANMKPVPRYEERTVYGDLQHKVGASIVQLSARPPGFGNRCQFLIFELARAAGIKDLAARCLRSKNPMNVCKAAYGALMGQKLPEDVARARGVKLVDVRKVYYQGLV